MISFWHCIICNANFIYFAALEGYSKTYQIVAIVLTFLMLFLLMNNIGSYDTPESISEFKTNWLAEIENQKGTIGEDPAGEYFLKYVRSDINDNLKEVRFKKQSLFRIVGSFISLLGVIFLRLRKEIGLHLFLAGMLFSIFSSFYLFGFGFIGWTFNFIYLLILFGFGTYFLFQRNNLE